MLGRIVEVVSGRPFRDFLHEEIFGPLGMVDTDFVVPPGKAHRFASCFVHSPDGKLLDVSAAHPVASAANYLKDDCAGLLCSGGGGLVSTPRDYEKFCAMICAHGGLRGGGRLLSRRTVELMCTNCLPGGVDCAALDAGGFAETKLRGIGFGLGFAVVVNPGEQATHLPTGSVYWGGMASTTFWIDHSTATVGIAATQLIPSHHALRSELRSVAYALFAR